MFSKILLAVGVVLASLALGNALKCYKCDYTTAQPKEEQKCNNSVDCTSEGNCLTTLLKFDNTTESISRDCGEAIVCQNTDKLCAIAAVVPGVKSCAADCCTGDNCNNYIPSSATGVMVTKFTLSLMVIFVLIFA